jgi:hypothetical protein
VDGVRRLLFNLGAAGSVAVFCLAQLAWDARGNVEFSPPPETPGEGFYVGIQGWCADRMVVMVSDPVIYSYCSPYRAPDPTGPTITGVRKDTLYYRHVRWQTGETAWVAAFSLKYPMGIALVLPGWWVMLKLWSLRKRHRCPGFDMIVKPGT